MVRRRKQQPIVAAMGDALRRWVEQLHTESGESMTYTDVARDLELEGDRPQERVGAWVRGTNTIPTLCIWQIWRKLGLSPNALFGLKDKEMDADEDFVVQQIRLCKRHGWQAGVEAIKSVASAQASVSRRLAPDAE